MRLNCLPIHLITSHRIDTIMNNLLASLGLDSVSADPNAIPDNRYNGEVVKSEFVVAKKKGTFNHVITYRVTEGDHKGAEKAEWFKLGEDCVTADGQPAERASDVANYTPSMTDNAKTWYKKRYVDLGISEEKVGRIAPEDLVGIKVTFGTKTSNGYQNINYVEAREATASEQASVPQALGTDNILGSL